MADKMFKVEDVISVEFQATSGSVSATLNVYDEAGALDENQSGAMAQVGATNLWRKSFTPDVVGIWFIQAIDSKGGKAVKSYSVGTYNIEAVGGEMAKDSTVAKEATVAKDSTVAKEATVAKDSTVAKEATVAKEETLSAVQDLIASLATPPSIG